MVKVGVGGKQGLNEGRKDNVALNCILGASGKIARIMVGFWDD